LLDRTLSLSLDFQPAIFLPAEFLSSDDQPHPPSEQHGASLKTSGPTRLRVLVVDDEPLIAQTVTAILNMNGFDATEALSGQAALEAVRQIQPDIVLSDVLMPRMSGVELGIKIRQEFPAARVILFSGQAATSELMRKALAEGYSFELFPKPIHPDELLAKLRSL
jgi:DNA-binding response OmpR family regulator